MGKRGPRPEPSILKYIRGNPSKTPVNTAEPTPDLLPQDFPPTALVLSSESASACWKETIARLSNARLMTVADVPMIERYCIAYSRYLIAYDTVRQYGEHWTNYEDDPAGNGKKRIKYAQVGPWASQMLRWDAVMFRIEREFGMSPSSRSQVKTHEQPKSNPVSDFIAERRDKGQA